MTLKGRRLLGDPLLKPAAGVPEGGNDDGQLWTTGAEVEVTRGVESHLCSMLKNKTKFGMTLPAAKAPVKTVGQTRVHVQHRADVHKNEDFVTRGRLINGFMHQGWRKGNELVIMGQMCRTRIRMRRLQLM